MESRAKRIRYRGAAPSHLPRAHLSYVLDKISALQWGMVDVSGTKYRLVTFDRPVVRTDGLTKPDSHLAIPLSPTRLFIATNNPQTTAQFQSMPPRDLVMRMNKRVARNAITYVWDTDLTNEALIKGQLSADAGSDPRHQFPEPAALARK